jgi:hypothetical protein
MLRDYLFLDEKRINSFFEQISDPNKHVRTGAVKAIFSFPKIGVETELKTESRPYTLNEKISALEDFLFKGPYKDHSLEFDLEEGKYKAVRSFPRQLEFIKFRNFKASRILISDKKNTEIILWVSQDPSVKVYILEQMSNIDSRPVQWSSYSTFNALLREFESEHRVELRANMSDEEIRRFDENPSFYLSKLGKMSSAPRIISCLLKIRYTFMGQTARKESNRIIIGYPICIY